MVLIQPIPLELLQINRDMPGQTATQDISNKIYQFTLIVPNKFGGPFSLQALTQADRDSWTIAIEKEKFKLHEKKRKFDMESIVLKGFPFSNPINCCAFYQERIIIGTNSGLFVSNPPPKGSEVDLSYFRTVKVLDLENITQIDINPKNDMLLALAG
jgi:hypothetical protein